MSYEGVLPVIKPAHFTSHDVVAKLRRILQLKRIGHTGTLDPLVTGVLPVCLGRATRMVEYIQDLPKQYEAELILGLASDTEDSSGTIISRLSPETLIVDERELRQALESFVGEIAQVPPMYSAVKINGQKLYHLARSGMEVERAERRVTVHSMEWLSVYRDSEGYPRIRFRTTCSKGTYIRTLCVDIGKKLGLPALMSHLIRTESGGFDLDESFTLEDIEQLHIKGLLQRKLIPADVAVRHLPEWTMDAEEARRGAQGQKVRVTEALPLPDQATVRLYTADKQFVGLFIWDDKQSCIIPHKVW